MPNFICGGSEIGDRLWEFVVCIGNNQNSQILWSRQSLESSGND